MSEKRPFIKFFYRDWLSDFALSGCAAATRGIWFDLLCRMHDADSGMVSGTIAELARLARATPDEMSAALDELGRSGTAEIESSDDGRIVVTCRRVKIESDRRAKDRARKQYKRDKNREYYLRDKITEQSSGGSTIRTKFGQNSDTPTGDVNRCDETENDRGVRVVREISAPLLHITNCFSNPDTPVRDREFWKLDESERLMLDEILTESQCGELSGRASELADVLGGADSIDPDDHRDRRLVIGTAFLVMVRAINADEYATAIRATKTKPLRRRVGYFYGTMRGLIGERTDGPTFDELLNSLRVPAAPFPRVSEVDATG